MLTAIITVSSIVMMTMMMMMIHPDLTLSLAYIHFNTSTPTPMPQLLSRLLFAPTTQDPAMTAWWKINQTGSISKAFCGGKSGGA